MDRSEVVRQMPSSDRWKWNLLFNRFFSRSSQSSCGGVLLWYRRERAAADRCSFNQVVLSHFQFMVYVDKLSHTCPRKATEIGYIFYRFINSQTCSPPCIWFGKVFTKQTPDNWFFFSTIWIVRRQKSKFCDFIILVVNLGWDEIRTLVFRVKAPSTTSRSFDSTAKKVCHVSVATNLF